MSGPGAIVADVAAISPIGSGLFFQYVRSMYVPPEVWALGLALVLVSVWVRPGRSVWERRRRMVAARH
jgi:hypothetical protein